MPHSIGSIFRCKLAMRLNEPIFISCCHCRVVLRTTNFPLSRWIIIMEKFHLSSARQLRVLTKNLEKGNFCHNFYDDDFTTHQSDCISHHCLVLSLSHYFTVVITNFTILAEKIYLKNERGLERKACSGLLANTLK